MTTPSQSDRAKLAAAKALIEEKRYSEARALLRGVKHPTAKVWLDRLETISPARRKRRVPILAFSVIGILTLAVIVFATLIVLREREKFVATQVAEQTTVAANATLEWLEQLQKIEVGAALTTYCTSVAERSQGDCRRWSDTILSSKYAEADFCDSEYDWITDGANFGICLLTQGIAVLGDQPFITPIDENAFTDEDIALQGALIAYCDDEKSDDYCYVWAVMMFINQRQIVDTCNIQRINGSILGFFDCLRSQGLRP